MHVHLREPGAPHKEDWYTGTSAAVAGGVVAVVDMPNTNPPTLTAGRLGEKEQIAGRTALCDYGFYFGTDGNNLAEFEKVYDRVCGLKLYLNETTGSLLIEDKKKIENIFRAWPKGKPILAHAEGDTLAHAIDLAAQCGQRLHGCHIATAHDLARVVEAKQGGVKITCEVTPHHLLLTEKDAARLGAFGQMKPEVGTDDDREALWEGIQRGVVDSIATDHAPHTREEKQSGIPVWGVPGLETSLPLMITACEERHIMLEVLQRLMSVNPRVILGLPDEENSWVEITREEYRLEENSLKTKCGWSPFVGRILTAKVRRTVIRGTEVMKDGKIMARAGSGKNLNSFP